MLRISGAIHLFPLYAFTLPTLSLGKKKFITIHRVFEDYIMVKRRLKNLVQDIKIFWGSDIGLDQYLLPSQINLSRWKQQNNNSKLANELV